MFKGLKQFIFAINTKVSKKYYFYESLANRSIIELTGTDSQSLLQGLTSNDISSTQSNFNSVYSLFLNAKGRILFDVIIYNNKHRIYLECDKAVSGLLIKHISMYKLRKKVDISEINGAQVSIILPESEIENIESLKIHENNENLIYFGSDPRISCWLIRMVSLIGIPVPSLVPVVRPGPPNCYRDSRLKQGVCEGIEDFVPGVSLPLEHNGDILHGISFNKGCYIGQELTARTHHTGIVRKRVMPLRIDGEATNLSLLKGETTLFSDEGRSVVAGVVKSFHENGTGLGVMRLSNLTFLKLGSDKCRQFRNLWLGDRSQTSVSVWCPMWWPGDVVLPC